MTWFLVTWQSERANEHMLPTLFMAPTKQASVRPSITFKGITEFVTESFKYVVNKYVFTITAYLSGQWVF